MAVVVCTQQNAKLTGDVPNSEHSGAESYAKRGWRILLICSTIKAIDCFSHDLILSIKGALLVDLVSIE